jgi:hypothetical protein
LGKEEKGQGVPGWPWRKWGREKKRSEVKKAVFLKEVEEVVVPILNNIY